MCTGWGGPAGPRTPRHLCFQGLLQLEVLWWGEVGIHLWGVGRGREGRGENVGAEKENEGPARESRLTEPHKGRQRRPRGSQGTRRQPGGRAQPGEGQ